MPVAAVDHSVWANVRKHIKPEELRRPYEMDVDFLYLLYQIRVESGVPLRFISDARSPDQDVGVANSAHHLRPCPAVDLQVLNANERYRLVAAALKHGIKRIGIYPGKPVTIAGKKYKDAGSVHLDNSMQHPRSVIWTRY